MTRLLLITLLFLSSGPAYAEWVSVISNDQAGMIVYADSDTIRHKGGLVKMWELFDYEAVQTVAGRSFLSSKTQSEYDCAEERHRILAIIHISGNMGRGNVVYSNSDEEEWEPVAPDSISRELWEVACGKR
jgi:surface-adhesin protein E